MRLHLLLAKVEPKAMPVPSKCGYANCTSKQVRLHQPVKKALRDTVHKPRGSASLSLSQMPAHLSGVSAWSHACTELGAGQRVGGDVVSVGTLVWSGVPRLRQLGSHALQDASLPTGCATSGIPSVEWLLTVLHRFLVSRKQRYF